MFSKIGGKINLNAFFKKKELKFSLQSQILGTGDKDKADGPLAIPHLLPHTHFSFWHLLLGFDTKEKTQEENSGDWEYMYVPTYFSYSSCIALSYLFPAPTACMGAHTYTHNSTKVVFKSLIPRSGRNGIANSKCIFKSSPVL